MLTRRGFLLSVTALRWLRRQGAVALNLASLERARVLGAADRYLREAPMTIAASRSTRSAGGLHDYFSEGDYWWPVRHCLLLFGGLALDRPDYIDVWRKLNPDPVVDEVIRNHFIRQPVLWISGG